MNELTYSINKAMKCLEKLTISQLAKKFPVFHVTGSLLLCSKETATCQYPEPN
jgi:hypothetical protein